MAHIKRIAGLKYTWNYTIYDSQNVMDIAIRYMISSPLAEVLLSRGFTSKEEIELYLFSSIDRDVFSPLLLKDAEKAVDRLICAIHAKEKIIVFGDYDVDGITSSALFMSCLLDLGADVNFYIPHRVKEGYGLSVNVIERAAKNGYSVIVTVDNGITAFEPALAAKKLGIDLIVTDHHRPHSHVPDAFAIIDPYQKDCQYPFKGFAGVGVIFKIISLLCQKMNVPLSDKVYELLLLGTVADVVPLRGENRFWVRHCLQYVNKVESCALKVLKENGKITKDVINSSDIGFKITPQINALGRLDDPRQGVAFLLSTNMQEARLIGSFLHSLNQARREIERVIFNEVRMLIEKKDIDISKENIIFAASSLWAPGVIGLVASRLVAEYNRPVLLFHLTKQGIAKGSCRSIHAFNIFNALQENEQLLLQFGGHSIAAGLSLKIENLHALKESLEYSIVSMLKPEDFEKKLMIDAKLYLSDLTHKIVRDMDYFEPFGADNPQPIFYISQVCMVQLPQLLKNDHVKCMISSDGIVKSVIFFNRPDLYEILIAHGSLPFDIAAQIIENEWQGKINIELLGIDVAFGGDV